MRQTVTLKCDRAPRTVRPNPRQINRSRTCGAFTETILGTLATSLHHQVTMLPADGLFPTLVVLAALCSALAAGALAAPLAAPEPIRCAPCTSELLSQCPAVAPGCAEVLREPGCGCCLACALPAGELCGIHTAPCGSGLRCSPRPGDPRPLHSLTKGQAVCTASAEPPSTPEPQQTQGRPPRQSLAD